MRVQWAWKHAAQTSARKKTKAKKAEEGDVTLPYERLRAVREARRFLTEITTPGGFYKRNISPMREMAKLLLRHYPSDSELAEIAKKCPELLSEDQ